MEKAPEKYVARTALGTLTVVIGLLCLLGAVGFGLFQTVRVSVPREQAAAEAPNTTAAGAACGLAIAGGLCFVAAAIAESGAARHRPPRESDRPA